MKKLLLGTIILMPTLAFAVDMPEIKPGLWEVSVTVDGQPQDKMKQCVDADTAKILLNAGQKMLGDSCSEVKMEKSGADYVSNMECNLGISKMKASTKLSGDFNSHYVSETKTSFNPPMMGRGESTSTSDGRWVGPCEKGMKPGDTIMADGRRMNVIDMMNKMPDLGKLQGLTNGADGAIDLEKLKNSMPDMEEMQKALQQQQ